MFKSFFEESEAKQHLLVTVNSNTGSKKFVNATNY